VHQTIALLGPPGSGKGTQAARLQEEFGYTPLSTGNLLRAARLEDTELGRRAAEYMDRGDLVPDELILGVVREAADDFEGKAVLLDGFPRTRAQAEALDRVLAEEDARVERALLIDVPTEDLVRRMAGRRVCQANGHPFNITSNPPHVPGICDIDGSPLIHRDDDREETVRARMATQIPPLEEVVDHYRKHGVLVSVDGRLPIDEVQTALVRALDAQGDPA